MRPALAGEPDGAAGAIAPALLAERLSRIEDMLRDNDASAAEAIGGLAGLAAPAALLERLREKAEAYDFDGARPALADLRAALGPSQK